MKEVIWRTIFTAAVICASCSFLFAQPTQQPATQVDLGSFTKEIMLFNFEADRTDLALWFPFEFFVHANMSTNNGSRANVEKEISFLRNYHTIIVQRGVDQEDGTEVQATAAEVRGVLKMEDGEEIAPLTKIPPLVMATVEAMKILMASDGGTDKMHILVFPTTTPAGKLLCDTTKRGKLTLVLKAQGPYKERTFTWHTPFDAVMPVPPCAKCKETISAKWAFCPWCGATQATPAAK